MCRHQSENIEKRIGSVKLFVLATYSSFPAVLATDLEAFKKTADLRKEFYGNNLPTATWVEVKRLFDPSFVVQTELIAEFLSR